LLICITFLNIHYIALLWTFKTPLAKPDHALALTTVEKII
jgi:hypothetical protein